MQIHLTSYIWWQWLSQWFSREFLAYRACFFSSSRSSIKKESCEWFCYHMNPSLQFFRRKNQIQQTRWNPSISFFSPWISHGLQAGSVRPVWHCTLLWFGYGEGAGNRKKGSVEEFLWIELPIGNRDTFCVGCLFTSLPGALWGWECGVDFGVSSKFQGVGSNLLSLKLVTLPSSSLQTCQNPDLLPPFFFGTAVSKFWTLQMWSKKCVARFGSQESGCQGAGGGVATRFVGSQVAGWMFGWFVCLEVRNYLSWYLDVRVAQMKMRAAWIRC